MAESGNNNLQTLGDNLFDVFEKVRDGKMSKETADTLVSVSNTIINGAKVQLAGIKHLQTMGHEVSLTGNSTIKKIIGDVFDRKYEFAKQLGYENVADAYKVIGKEAFEKKFTELQQQ